MQHRRTRVLRFALGLMLAIVLLVGPAAAPLAAQPIPEASTDQDAALLFIENVGQFDAGVRFQVWGGGGTLWLAEDGLWLTLLAPTPPASDTERMGGRALLAHAEEELEEARQGIHLRLSFEGANPSPRLEPFARSTTVASYFLGNDPNKWRPSVPVWGGVRYVDLYPGVDLEVSSVAGSLAWRMVAKSDATRQRAALAAVRLRVEGADEVALEGGRLRLQTRVGAYALPLLQVQVAEGVKAPSPSVMGDQVVAPFGDVPAEEAQMQAGASDLLYATFLGGDDSDEGLSIAVDANGAAYVTGETYSSDFPVTVGAFDTSRNSTDAFVLKLNASGSTLAYATFLGGGSLDESRAIIVDDSGAAYVVGATTSLDFPVTLGAFDTGFNGGRHDAFVAKLSSDGSALSYATFLGGDDDDYARTIAVAPNGAMYVAGVTYSSNFPTTPDAFQTIGEEDAFVVKLNAAGSKLIYATLLGGGDEEGVAGIAIDANGAAYVTGETCSSDFPTTNGAFDTSFNDFDDRWSCDTFVSKLNASGSALVYSTFLGGSGDGDDFPCGLAVDMRGAAYVGGNTHSDDFPVSPWGLSSPGSYTFAARLNATGSDLEYAARFGGSSSCNGFAVDASGAVYMTGNTESPSFPTTPGAFDTSHNGGLHDAFMAKLSATGSMLIYATFLGGSESDNGYGLAVDATNAVYVVGATSSSDFPITPGAFDVTCGAMEDVFVVKLAEATEYRATLPIMARD